MEKTKYSRTKPNSNSIYLPTQLYQMILEGKLQHKEDTCTKKQKQNKTKQKKGQDIKHLTTKSKAESHKHIKPPTKANISGTNSHLSLISPNINWLILLIKGHVLTDWLHKHDPAFCCIQETHLNNKNKHYLRVKVWKKGLPSKWSQGISRSCHPNIQ